MPGYFLSASFTPRTRSSKFRLAGNGDEHDVSMTFQDVGHALGALLPGAKIVRADEHDALGIGASESRQNDGNALATAAAMGA